MPASLPGWLARSRSGRAAQGAAQRAACMHARMHAMQAYWLAGWLLACWLAAIFFPEIRVRQTRKMLYGIKSSFIICCLIKTFHPWEGKRVQLLQKKNYRRIKSYKKDKKNYKVHN